METDTAGETKSINLHHSIYHTTRKAIIMVKNQDPQSFTKVKVERNLKKRSKQEQ